MAARDYIQFHDGFDGKDLTRAYISSGGALESTITSLSRYAWRWNVSAGVGYASYGQYLNANGGHFVTSGTRHARASFHMYISSFPSAGTFYYVAAFDNVGSYPATLSLNEFKNLVVVPSGLGGEGDATVLETGVWYVVTFSYHVNGGAGASLSYVVRNRDTGATVASKTHSANMANAWSYFDLGPLGTSTGDVIFDNFVICTDDYWANLDDPVNFLTTKYACGLLLPDGTGSYSAWTNNYTYDDEVPNDGVATYRQKDTSAGAFTETLQATAGLAAQVGTVFCAIGVGYVWGSVSSNCDVSVRIRSSGVDADTTAYNPNTSVIPLQQIRRTDPGTSSYWTVSGIDSAEVGANRTATAITSNYCTAVHLEILYTMTVVDRTPRVAYVFDVWDRQQRIYDEMGRPVPYNEIRPNRWMRLTSVETPTAYQPATFIQEKSVVYIEGTIYTQELGRPPRLELKGAPDDFLPNLLRRIQDSGGGV